MLRHMHFRLCVDDPAPDVGPPQNHLRSHVQSESEACQTAYVPRNSIPEVNPIFSQIATCHPQGSSEGFVGLFVFTENADVRGGFGEGEGQKPSQFIPAFCKRVY